MREVAEKYIRIVQDMYEGARINPGKKQCRIPVVVGLHQGSSLSP